MAPRKRRSTTCGAPPASRVRRARVPSLRAREAEGDLPGQGEREERGSSPPLSTNVLSTILARMDELDARMNSVISAASDSPAGRAPGRTGRLRRSEATVVASRATQAEAGPMVPPAPGGELVDAPNTQQTQTLGLTQGSGITITGPSNQATGARQSVQGGSGTTEGIGAVCAQVWASQASQGAKASSSSGSLPSSLIPSVRDQSPSDPLAQVRPEAIPWGDIETPLSYHLLPATKEKIWKGEYIDIFTLLNREQPKRDKDEEKDKEGVRKPKIEKCLSSWLYAFLIYHSVVVEKEVHRTHELLKYQDIIVRTHYEFGGTAWLQYDEAFRMRAALKPLRWDERRLDLWLQATQLCKASGSTRTDSGHFMQPSTSAAQAPRTVAGSGVRMSQLCYEFSSKGSCTRTSCKYKHGCGVCGGFHATSICSRARGPRPGRGQGVANRAQQGQSQGKGAQSN